MHEFIVSECGIRLVLRVRQMACGGPSTMTCWRRLGKKDVFSIRGTGP